MLLGHWKNIEELEDNLNLDELELIVKSLRDRERREQKFLAALKGINLDDETNGEETGEEALERIQKRAQLRAQGLSEDEVERQVEYGELSDMGFEVETDE